MSRRFRLLWLVALLAWLPHASASTGRKLSFPEQDLEIEIPEGWASIPPPEGAFAHFQDHAREKNVVLILAELPKGVPADAATFALGAKKSALAGGNYVVGEGQLSLPPLTFQTLKAAKSSNGPPRIYMCTTFVNDSALSLMMIALETDPSADPEFDSILRSLHFLHPPVPTVLASTLDGAPSTIGGLVERHLGLIAGLILVLLIATTFLIVLLVKRNRAKPAPALPPIQKF